MPVCRCAMTSKSAYDLSRLKLLIVDDDQHMQTLLRTIVRGIGIENVKFEDKPAHVLAAIATFNPDIMLLDLQMPETDGLELARHIRRDEKSPNPYLPMIAVSAAADRTHVTAARDAGINEFLAKPLSAASVYDRIVSIIEKPRPFVRNSAYAGPCRRRLKKLIYRGVEQRSAAGKTLAQAVAKAHREDGKGAAP